MYITVRTLDMYGVTKLRERMGFFSHIRRDPFVVRTSLHGRVGPGMGRSDEGGGEGKLHDWLFLRKIWNLECH